MTEETRLLWSVLKNWILSIMKALNLREISVPVSGASSSDNIDKPQAKHDSKDAKSKMKMKSTAQTRI